MFFAGLLIFVFLFFNFLFGYVAPFTFGLLIAIILNFPANLLIKKAKFKPWLAALLCLALFLALIGVLGTWLVRTLLTQAVAFAEAAPEYIDEISNLLIEWQSRLPGIAAAVDVEGFLLGVVPEAFGDGLMDQSRKLVTNVPNFFLGVILSVVSAFFMIKDKRMILDTLKKHCPPWLVENVVLIRDGLSRALSGYFKAQGILMSITCIICIGGLLILGSPYALILGITMAFVDFLPFFGTGIIIFPWAVFCLATGAYGRAAGLAALYAAVFIMRQILEPKVLSVQIGVYPLVTLIAIYAGFRLFGFIGMIVGPALVMMFIAVNKKSAPYTVGGGSESSVIKKS